MNGISGVRLDDLYYDLKNAGLPESDGTYICTSIYNRKDCYLGLGIDGQPSLLISVSKRGSLPPPLRLEHLSADYAVSCRLQTQDAKCQMGKFSVIRCIGGDEQLALYFVRMLDVILDAIPTDVTYEELGRAVTILVELFQKMNTPPIKAIAGLWAELLLVAEATNPNELINSWHYSSSDRYDFAMGKSAIEVKSTQGNCRCHHFRYEQVRPEQNLDVIVASVLLRRVEHGENIFDLLRRITHRICNNSCSIERVTTFVANALGKDWREANHIYFDYKWARDSLQFYAAKDVPSIVGPIPVNVSDVHFFSNLTTLTALLKKDLENDSLFVCLNAGYWE